MLNFSHSRQMRLGREASPDTIVALSSGHLPSGVAVVRVSGPGARAAIASLSGSLPVPRMARYGALRSPDGALLDHGLTLLFPAPNSFTGEDCAEFQVHGGRAVVEAVLETITGLPGCRLAQPGEFSRRAFLNGKMDLLATEATADIVNAETEAQRRFAMLNSGGGHAALYAQWRERLIRARAFIEAELDFSDEGDVPGSVSDEIWRDVAALRREIDAHAAGYGKAEIVRDGFDVVLIGAPNAGKSSLLNALAHRDVAIVTAEPGTTRDLIEVALDIGGLKVRVTDTAGIRGNAGTVEMIGIERALARARTAGLVLLLEDLTDPVAVEEDLQAVDVVRIGTKADLAPPGGGDDHDLRISCVSGQGLPDLLDMIGRKARAAAPLMGELVPWRIRHVELLHECSRQLDAALADPTASLELRSEELRLAATALGRISGAVDVEDLLDVIFSQFCIGK
ncbi:tRNA uridine-5-carboxymethylaminomethyl(34) synthesis GTPase MnmE [Mesorhizobium sp. LHD-90]|uniref:tRNA uridine-5-carboxymethylaminomethyl(34) synthesis GTPase MnmE n=1 Tax=Mesorhizobium sp. LHD-90 TaxID=3071414 RepID=UPI0027DFD4B6|nr:tRNA uridine-5-carboxymethylaminomethyl(34) synthesis GTPase MnmE [Mesorhizobium sp. LHD-90]MDQ6434162.1 tRNA uridine-5-carboxymethylaminomethyl(34) synthesis GTPase MnmE [Mesorhizobium sp. LHD-90]